MPLVFGGLVALGLGNFWSWRLAMIVPGALMLVTAVAYFLLTQDTPRGNLRDLRPTVGGADLGVKKSVPGTFLTACRDARVWALALIYGACFGVEITIHNIAALYFTDTFHVGLAAAGAIVGAFGLLALFARTLGGFLSDKVQLRFGMNGRVTLLGVAVLVEGALLIVFSRMTTLPMAVIGLIAFGLLVHVCCGATYAVIPFVNRKAVGAVAGIVGAGGNVGAVLSGLLFKGAMPWPTALLLLGVLVTAASGLALFVQVREPSAAEDGAAAAPGTADVAAVPASLEVAPA
jgi:NNP family nitrate/nitrite transporter-like MFS transporter